MTDYAVVSEALLHEANRGIGSMAVDAITGYRP